MDTTGSGETLEESFDYMPSKNIYTQNLNRSYDQDYGLDHQFMIWLMNLIKYLL